MQRKSHLLEDKQAAHVARRPPYRRRRWQIGMAMFIVANLAGSSIQITTLPLPVLSTLQASGLVFNSICASILLSEPFTVYSFLGTVLVTVGALLIALFGAITEPAHTLDQLLSLLGRPAFLAWFILTFIFSIVILVCSRALHYLLSSRPTFHRLIRGISYGTVSGILSAHTLLVAKTAVELLVRSFTSANQFNRFESWLLLLLLVFLALSQLYFLHRGLKLVSTSVLYPLVFGVYNIIAILDGLIYFRQAPRLPPLHAGLIALGTLILLSGVFALSWRLEPDQTQSTSDLKAPTSPVALPVPPSALAPGLGLANDIHPSPPSSPTTPTDLERQPLLPRTPSLARADNLLAQTAPMRAAETAEILDELNDTASLRAVSPLRSRRRASTLGLGLGLAPGGAAWGANSTPDLRSNKRRSGGSPLARESTPLLLEGDERRRLGRAATVGGVVRRGSRGRRGQFRGQPSRTLVGSVEDGVRAGARRIRELFRRESDEG
ncbi:MAG: hypothetical protein M1814_002265 [Vezdaea aestivalis]|nr:MAG: hypothetical protein M1814_002265 [Vezdaea aestivalis]